MDVAWQDDRPNGRLIAVMRFSAADIEKIISRSASVMQESAVKIQVEPWFPQELVAQGEMSGDGTLKGKMYAADMFLQPPYSTGRMVRIDEADYIYLEVSMK